MLIYIHLSVQLHPQFPLTASCVVLCIQQLAYRMSDIFPSICNQNLQIRVKSKRTTLYPKIEMSHVSTKKSRLQCFSYSQPSEWRVASWYSCCAIIGTHLNVERCLCFMYFFCQLLQDPRTPLKISKTKSDKRELRRCTLKCHYSHVQSTDYRYLKLCQPIRELRRSLEFRHVY